MTINRREAILKRLKETQTPIKGDKLGEDFSVSRQIIVKDIAVLRARGEDIISTTRGYIIPNSSGKYEKKIVSIHEGVDAIEEELKIIIDAGGKVKDVIVDHPVYGEIKVALEIENRKDIKNFLKDIRLNDASPLSDLTEGIHMHTIVVDEEDDFLEMEKKLIEKNYLIK